MWRFLKRNMVCTYVKHNIVWIVFTNWWFHIILQATNLRIRKLSHFSVISQSWICFTILPHTIKTFFFLLLTTSFPVWFSCIIFFSIISFVGTFYNSDVTLHNIIFQDFAIIFAFIFSIFVANYKLDFYKRTLCRHASMIVLINSLSNYFYFSTPPSKTLNGPAVV